MRAQHEATTRADERARAIFEADKVFTALFASPDWDGQCSIGFAATVSQRLGDLADPGLLAALEETDPTETEEAR